MGKLSDSVGNDFATYFDYLQAPLQPLMDDLGSATYDVFERDPVKYRQYEEVSRRACVACTYDVSIKANKNRPWCWL